MQNKVIVQGKVVSQTKQKFIIEREKASEIDAYIDIEEDGNYEVEKLSVDGLPTHMPDKTPIRWFNNFSIKQDGQYINQKYFVTIAGLSSSNVVIVDRNGEPYYYKGTVENDTIELTDGDPGVGSGP